MANWKHVLDIKQEWEDYKNGKINIINLTFVIIEKLKKINEIEHDDDLGDIIQAFEDYKDYEINDDNEQEIFDGILEDLYDWADQPVNKFTKLCWVAAF